MDRLALRLRLHRLDGLPLEAVNLLHDITPGSTMKSGYLLINDKDCCWHSWVETKDGEVLDINYHLATLKDPEFGSCKVERLTEKPTDLEVHEDPDTVERFNMNKKDFWKSAPKKFRDLRTKVQTLSRS